MSRSGSGRFQRGTSGNPGGLPAYVRSVRMLAGQKAPRALTRLAEMMEDSDLRIALPACLAILDRAGIRPVDVHVNLGNQDLVQNLLDETPEIDPAELERLAQAPGRIDPRNAKSDQRAEAVDAQRPWALGESPTE